MSARFRAEAATDLLMGSQVGPPREFIPPVERGSNSPAPQQAPAPGYRGKERDRGDRDQSAYSSAESPLRRHASPTCYASREATRSHHAYPDDASAQIDLLGAPWLVISEEPTVANRPERR